MGSSTQPPQPTSLFKQYGRKPNSIPNEDGSDLDSSPEKGVKNSRPSTTLKQPAIDRLRRTEHVTPTDVDDLMR